MNDPSRCACNSHFLMVFKAICDRFLIFSFQLSNLIFNFQLIFPSNIMHGGTYSHNNPLQFIKMYLCLHSHQVNTTRLPFLLPRPFNCKFTYFINHTSYVLLMIIIFSTHTIFNVAFLSMLLAMTS